MAPALCRRRACALALLSQTLRRWLIPGNARIDKSRTGGKPRSRANHRYASASDMHRLFCGLSGDIRDLHADHLSGGRGNPVAILSSHVVRRLEMAATRLLDYFSAHSFSESGGQPLSANQKSAGSLFGRGLVGTGCECDCFRRPADVDHVVRGGAVRDPTVYFNEVFVGQPVGA